PGPRHVHAMAFNPKRGVVMMVGGDNVDTPLSDAWEYDGVDWKPIAAAPSPISRAQLAYEPTFGRMIAYGGGSISSGTYSDTTFIYDNGVWSQQTSSTPGPRRIA